MSNETKNNELDYTEEELSLLNEAKEYNSEADRLIEDLNDQIESLETEKEEIYASLRETLNSYKQSSDFDLKSEKLFEKELNQAKKKIEEINKRIDKVEGMIEKVNDLEGRAINSSSRPTVKETVINTCESIKDKLTAAKDRAIEAVGNFWNKIRNAFAKAAQKVADIFGKKVEAVKEWNEDVAKRASYGAKRLGNQMKMLGESLLDYSSTNLFTPQRVIDRTWAGIGSRYCDSLESGPEKGLAKAVQILREKLDMVTFKELQSTETVRNAMKQSIDDAKQFLTDIKTGLDAKIQSIKTKISGVISHGKSIARNARIAAVSTVRNAQDFLIGAAHRVSESAKNLGAEMVAIKNEGTAIREGKNAAEAEPDFDLD